MAAQPALFPELLSSSIALVRERSGVLLPGLLFFLVISVVVLMGTTTVVGPAFMNGGTVLQGQDVAAAVAAGVGLGLFTGVVGMVAYLYYILAITQKEASFGTILGQTFPRILPMIWLSILMMIRSFTWIALLAVPFFFSTSTAPLGILLIAAGIVCGIVFGPRYMLAPVIWIVEKKTPAQAVQRSYDVTTGYWGKVLGNLILLGLLALLVMIVVSIVTGIVAGIVGTASAQAGTILNQVISTFMQMVYQIVMIAFMIKLTATLIAHPRTATKKI